MIPEIEKKLDSRLLKLWKDLIDLHTHLRTYIAEKYQRINPFYENLFDWKEKGQFLTKNINNITIYESATIIGDVSIGPHTWIGPFCLIDGSGGLSIGENCSISTGSQILTHDTVKWALSGGRMSYEYSPTSIGNCCFIGTHSIIVKGITIGNHCLIGGNTLVNKDIPNNSIAVGNPAKIIGEVVIADDGDINLIYQDKY